MIKKQAQHKQQQISIGTQIIEFSWFKQHEIVYEQPTNHWKQLIFDNFEWFLILLFLIYCITFYFMYKVFSKKANIRKESLASDDMQNSVRLSTEQNELHKKDTTSSTESSPRQNNFTQPQDFVQGIKQINKRKLTDISEQNEQQIKWEKNETDNNIFHREKNKDINKLEDYDQQKQFIKSDENHNNLKASHNIEQDCGKEQNQRIQQRLPDWSQYLENGKFKKLYTSPTIIGKGSFGEVYKCQKRVDLKEYAVKRIYFKVQNEKNLRDHPIFREINGLQEINHKNIVRFYTSWIEELSAEMIAEKKKLHDLVTEKQQEIQNNASIDSFHPQIIDDMSYLNDCVQFVGEGGTENDQQLQTISKNSQTIRSLHLSDFNSQVQSCMRKFHFNPNQKDELYQLFLLYIEMELCDCTLKDFIENVDRKKDQIQIKTIFKQIIEGVIYMHNQKFIHRDLKPQNIFINSRKEVKIGDLGLCNNPILQDDEELFQTNFEYTNNIGTPMYMAPEVKGDQYGYAADIYALGIILFEMLWKIKTNSEKFKLIQNLTKDNKLPPEFLKDYPIESDLILRMVSRNPNNRPTAQQIFETLNQFN